VFAAGLPTVNLNAEQAVSPIYTEDTLGEGLAWLTGEHAVAAVQISAQGQINVRSAVGLAAANLDAQLDALPTAAETAAAWGASVVGNGRTRDYFLQGGCNKIESGAAGTAFTIYMTDDATPLYTATATRLATTVGGLRAVDPA
jgi:hypothetical protein